MKNCSTIDPIIDTGASRSIGGLHAAQALASRIQLPLELKILPESERFLHGWGPQARDAALAKFSWTLPAVDNSGNKMSIRFYVTETRDPLVIGRDVLNSDHQQSREPSPNSSWQPTDYRACLQHIFSTRFKREHQTVSRCRRHTKFGVSPVEY